MVGRIFIAGATCRSAAESAARAGLEVAAADLFCDRDLQRCSHACQVTDYPSEILQLARQVPPCRWMYTGGLENQPPLVAAVSQHHALLGNGPAVLRAVREPMRLQRVLRDAGFRFPETSDRLPDKLDGLWIRKPRKSCGGMKVVRFSSEDLAEQSAGKEGVESGETHYFQQCVKGPVYGAVFVAGQNVTRLIGVTRQLVGRSWAGASGFLYVGSLGPVELDPRLHEQTQRLGNCLAAEFSLRGLFGVDMIVEAGRVWTIEVNPRFTASVEIHERATGWSAVRSHCLACEEGVVEHDPLVASGLHGKAVVYATESSRIDDSFCDHVDQVNQQGLYASFADLPHAGSLIDAHRPILTVLATGHRQADVVRQLRERSRQVHNLVRRIDDEDQGSSL